MELENKMAEMISLTEESEDKGRRNCLSRRQSLNKWKIKQNKIQGKKTLKIKFKEIYHETSSAQQTIKTDPH